MMNVEWRRLSFNSQFNIEHSPLALATGDHWSDFDLIAVVQHLVFGDEIIAFDHQMRFDDEIQLAQKFLNLLRAFDFDGSGWMA